MPDWRAVWGLEKGAGRYYLDLALFTIAWIGTLWVVASLTFTEWTEFDKKLILGTAFVIAACCILAYNRMLLVVGVAFMFAARGVLVLFFVSSAKMKVFAAALIMAAFFVFARFRNQPLKPYSHEQNS